MFWRQKREETEQQRLKEQVLRQVEEKLKIEDEAIEFLRKLGFPAGMILQMMR